jgi:hypothetical protein
MMQLVEYQSFEIAVTNEITVKDVATAVQLSNSGPPRHLTIIEQRFLYAMAAKRGSKTDLSHRRR